MGSTTYIWKLGCKAHDWGYKALQLSAQPHLPLLLGAGMATPTLESRLAPLTNPHPGTRALIALKTQEQVPHVGTE